MVVPFTHIPAAGQLRVPFVHIEFDWSKAGSPSAGVFPALVTGLRTSVGTVAAGTLVRVDTTSEGRTYFGEGSQLFDMVEAYRNNDPFGELWALAYDELVGGTAEIRSVQFGGAATEDAAVSLYVDGRLVELIVSSGDASAAIATAMIIEVNGADDMPYVASAGLAGEMLLTERNKGAHGDEHVVLVNYHGPENNEALPAGVTVVITVDTAGAGEPVITGIAAILGDIEYDSIAIPWYGTTELNVWQTLMNYTTGRWAWDKKVYGHVWTSNKDTPGALTTWGNLRNDPHVSAFALEPYPHASWQVTCAAMGQARRSLDINPARPLKTLPLLGILPAAKIDRFTMLQRNVLLFDGLATLVTKGNVVQIEQPLTTYQKDAQAVADDSQVKANTLYTAMRFSRYIDDHIFSVFPRHSLVNDDDPIEVGQAVANPIMVRNEIIAAYEAMQRLNWVHNLDLFVANLTTERALPGDPNRVNALVPYDEVNQFDVLAMLIQPRLEYSEAEGA